MSEYKIPDYTEGTEINDKMIVGSSPLKDATSTDNIKFEAEHEIDGMPAQGGTFRTANGGTRVEINQPDNTFGVFVDGRPVVAIGADVGSFPGGVIVFADGEGNPAGSIFAVTTAILAMDNYLLPGRDAFWDLGAATYQWNNIYLVHNPIVSSDRRLKENIRKIGYGLEAIEKLRPVQFLKQGKESLGFIAQEVNEVIPEVVENAGKEEVMAGLRYTEIIPVLVKAIQEQQEQIKSLTSELQRVKDFLVI